MVVQSSRSPLTGWDRLTVPSLLLLALVPYLGALANGFAWDDAFIVLSNPRVQAGEWVAALRAPWWPDAFTFSGSGLYRPVASAALALQWALWGERPLLFHAVSLLLHVGVVLLLFGLLRAWAPRWAAWAGAAVFAAHPVHVEAVANVVGQTELLAGFFVLTGCLLYQRWLASERVGERVLLLLGVGASYALGLGAKEIAVTLPALVVLITLIERRSLVRAVPAVALLSAVLLWMLSLRLQVVGSLRGEVPAPELLGLPTAARVWTGLGVWLDYARLLILPIDLVADYGPAVRFPAGGLDALVALGTLLLVALVGGAWSLRIRAPLASLGLAWIVVVLLPVSNLLVPAGVLLAERTLYLPSVGLACAVAAFGSWFPARAPVRAFVAGVLVVAALLALRSTWRVPVWRDSAAVMASLEASHPESHLVLRAHALRAMEQGRTEDARADFERALRLVPRHFSLLTEAAQFEALVGNVERARELASRAVEVYPGSPHGYVVASRVLLQTGDPVAARSVLVEGLRVADPMAPLWTELERSRTMTQSPP